MFSKSREFKDIKYDAYNNKYNDQDKDDNKDKDKDKDKVKDKDKDKDKCCSVVMLEGGEEQK